MDRLDQTAAKLWSLTDKSECPTTVCHVHPLQPTEDNRVNAELSLTVSARVVSTVNDHLPS
jgi:hypothetical protein